MNEMIVASTLALVFLLGAFVQKLPASLYQYYLEAFFGLTVGFYLIGWLDEPYDELPYHALWISLAPLPVLWFRKRRKSRAA